MTEVSEMGDILNKINKSPSQYFLNQNIKACFRKPNGKIDRVKSNTTDATG
jgi:hypothetical protein